MFDWIWTYLNNVETMLSKDQAGRVRVAAAEDKAAAAKVELESLQRVDWLQEQNKIKERYKYVVCIYVHTGANIKWRSLLETMTGKWELWKPFRERWFRTCPSSSLFDYLDVNIFQEFSLLLARFGV